MTRKIVLLAAGLGFVVLSSGALADPSILQAAIESRAGAAQAPGPMGPSGTAGPNAFYVPKTKNLAASVPLGWNQYHCGMNGWYFDGTNQWYYVFTQEQGVLLYELNNLNAGIGLLTACPLGNWQSVHVINSVTGAFNQTANWWFR